MDAPLHIGIVGHITYLKGAELVVSLVNEIERRKLDLQITLFGTLDQAAMKWFNGTGHLG